VTFQRPDFLVLVPAAAVVLALAVWLQWRRGRRLVEAYGGREPSLRLLGRDLTRFPVLRTLALILGIGGLAFAASGPEPGEAPAPPPPVPVDLLVAVDVSHSMSAADVDGTRIERARMLVERLVEERVADRMALTIFADWPYGLVPVTEDPDVLAFFAPWIAPELVGTRDQGTSLGLALGQVRATWERRRSEGTRRIVLLVTDGEVHDGAAEALDSVAAIADDGFEIWTAGLGTEEGAPLFLPGTRDAPLLYDGSPVIATADPTFLRELSSRGRGEFHDASTDGGIQDLVSALSRGSTPPPPAEERPDPIRWLLLASLLLLALEALLDAGVLGARRPARSGGGTGTETMAPARTRPGTGAPTGSPRGGNAARSGRAA
jgi:Ca-activated chloride channel family protein